MTITNQGRSITYTAVNEGGAIYPPATIVGMTFQGTGLTAAQRLMVTDSATPGAGNILADYLIEGAADNADLWVSRKDRVVSALSIANNTVAGTWVLTVFLE